MQAKAADRDVEVLLCGSKTTSNRSWLNHGLFTRKNHSWNMTGHGATGQQDIVPTKELLMVLRLCGGADLIRETEFAYQRLLRVWYKKFSTNQNQVITWLSQGCSNTILGMRLHLIRLEMFGCQLLKSTMAMATDISTSPTRTSHLLPFLQVHRVNFVCYNGP